jgi:hypothetical protein
VHPHNLVCLIEGNELKLRDIAGVEIASLTSLKKTVKLGAVLGHWGQIVNSDAHRLNEMAAHTRIHVTAPTVAEMRLALDGRNGRGLDILSLT